MAVKLIHGDSLEVLKKMKDNRIDALVSDPPYGWSLLGKEWDYEVPSVELWKECLRVMKPGAYGLVACGTRTQHRMAINLEDAGFEIIDIIVWVHMQGFPHSHDVAKAIEGKITTGSSNTKDFGKLQGERLDRGGWGISKLNKTQGYRDKDYTDETEQEDRLGKLEPTTEEAIKWMGWGTRLKPSWEAWTLIQKPVKQSSDLCYNDCIKEVIKCLLQSLVKIVEKNLKLNQKGLDGELDIVQWIVEENTTSPEDLLGLMDMLQSYTTEITNLNTVLSWLSTLIGLWKAKSTYTTKTELNMTTELKILKSMEWESILANIMQAKDSQINGLSASVYDVVSIFNVLRLKLETTPLPTVQENVLLDQKDQKITPETLLWTLCRKPLEEPTIAENVMKYGTGGINIDACRVPGEAVPINKLEQWSGFGQKERPDYEQEINTQGRWPANFIHDGSEEITSLFPYDKNGSMSRVFYCPKPSKREKNEGLESLPDRVGGGLQGTVDQSMLTGSGNVRNNIMKNNHPTAKSIKLMEYLVTLVTPPGGKVLDPFMGSGTTGIACVKLGFNFIGIDLEEEYVEIAKKRIEYHTKESENEV